ncbi:TonB-dependent receptor [Lichenicoccus roseus]|uniref:TonB-dependent receptor n=1 Tax=Lichenicoccus roseus TaxID=2683649 RepID=A0A5R9J6L5_9PROT|nr:TonB-dependent receptor [Lichenicoccus roseus]TLU73270.1 TonB-dependent receptor [Lichenicoccus roseus]
MSRRRTLLLISSIACVASGPADAAPADPPAASRHQVRQRKAPVAEHVEVVGRGRSALRHDRLQHVAASTSLLSAGKLQQLAIGTTRQITNLTPNLYQPRATVGYSNSNYFIRGIGELDAQGEPSVGTYIDGVYLPRTIGTMQELLDIDAIQIDRGPVGFTTGHQAEGGAVRIGTVVPDDTTRFTAQTGYGTYDEWVAGFAASGALVPDRVYASLAVEHHARDGVDHNYTLDQDENDIDYTQAHGKLRFTPTDALDITLGFDGTSDGSTNRGYGNLLNPYRYGLYSSIYPKNNYSEAGFTGTVGYQLDPHLRLSSVTGIRGYDDTGYYDNTGDPYARTSQLLYYRDRSYQEDTKLTGDYGRFSFTAGAYFFYEDWYTARRANNTFGTQTNVASNIRFQPVQALIDQITRNYAAYGLAQYKVLPTLTASVGLRYNYEQHSNSEVLNSLGSTPGYVANVAGDLGALFNAPPGGQDWTASAQQSWSRLLPKGSLDWQLAPHVAPYVTISQGGKSAGYDYRAQTPTALGRNQALLPYGPETVTTYEVGVKSDPLPGRLMLNGALFYNDFQNIQITTLDPSTGLSRRYNAGNGHSLGAEIETAWHVLPIWEIDATASYLFAELDRFNGSYSSSLYATGLAINNTPHSGERLPESPRFQFDIASNLILPLPRQIPGKVRLAGDISFQTAVFTDALENSQTELPEQTYLNALISWTSPHQNWTATLAARNILDRRYPQSLSFVQGNGIPVIWAASYADPRTVMFTLRYTL